jgi:hypothetical protein
MDERSRARSKIRQIEDNAAHATHAAKRSRNALARSTREARGRFNLPNSIEGVAPSAEADATRLLIVPVSLQRELAEAEANLAPLDQEYSDRALYWSEQRAVFDSLRDYAKAQQLDGWRRLSEMNTAATSLTPNRVAGDVAVEVR